MNKLNQLLAMSMMMGGGSFFGGSGYSNGNCEVCGKKNVRARRETGKFLCFEHLEGHSFSFLVGKTYVTQGGEIIQIVARSMETKGYETVIDQNGVHRYDRSDSKSDAGRVTGTAHDYSDLRNIKRETV